MRILAFCPFATDVLSGNVVTLRRIQREVRNRGHSFEILSVSPDSSPEKVSEAADTASPDLVHFYHAYKTGRFVPALRRRPAVVTVSGTDLNRDYREPVKKTVIDEALRGADRIVTYNPSLLAHEAISPHAAKSARIPKGVTLGSGPMDLRKGAGAGKQDPVILQAGGIRPEKNNLEAVDAVASLISGAPSLRLVFAGPILDEPYGREFTGRIQSHPWITHLSSIAPEAMAAAYRQATLILNTSRMEGLSNALMEAMKAGVAVVASDIPGNRDLIQDGETGFLYRPEALASTLRDLLEAPDRRAAAARAAREHADRTFSTERETDALLAAYSAALRARGASAS